MASRPLTPPWQPLEDAWKALPFAGAEDLASIDPINNDATKSPSAEATRVDPNERRVRFGAEMVSDFTSQVPETAAEGLVSVTMDIDEPARKVDVDAQDGTVFNEEASSKEVVAPTSKPKSPTSKPKNPTSKPKKKKTRPVSLTNPPLLPYMCRCADCAARRAEFLQTIGRRTVRWDEWPWCMVGDGYGTWYEEEVTDSEGEGDD